VCTSGLLLLIRVCKPLPTCRAAFEILAFTADAGAFACFPGVAEPLLLPCCCCCCCLLEEGGASSAPCCFCFCFWVPFAASLGDCLSCLGWYRGMGARRFLLLGPASVAVTPSCCFACCSVSAADMSPPLFPGVAADCSCCCSSCAGSDTGSGIAVAGSSSWP